MDDQSPVSPPFPNSIQRQEPVASRMLLGMACISPCVHKSKRKTRWVGPAPVPKLVTHPDPTHGIWGSHRHSSCGGDLEDQFALKGTPVRCSVVFYTPGKTTAPEPLPPNHPHGKPEHLRSKSIAKGPPVPMPCGCGSLFGGCLHWLH